MAACQQRSRVRSAVWPARFEQSTSAAGVTIIPSATSPVPLVMQVLAKAKVVQRWVHRYSAWVRTPQKSPTDALRLSATGLLSAALSGVSSPKGSEAASGAGRGAGSSSPVRNARKIAMAEKQAVCFFYRRASARIRNLSLHPENSNHPFRPPPTPPKVQRPTHPLPSSSPLPTPHSSLLAPSSPLLPPRSSLLLLAPSS